MTSQSSSFWNGKGVGSSIDESEPLRWKRRCEGFGGEDKDEPLSAESHAACWNSQMLWLLDRD